MDVPLWNCAVSLNMFKRSDMYIVQIVIKIFHIITTLSQEMILRCSKNSPEQINFIIYTKIK